MSFIAKGLLAGFLIASERAMVFGFCGSKRARSCFTLSEIGEYLVACALKNLTGLSSIQLSVTNSLNVFAIFVISELLVIGIMTLSGSFYPSCSAISKPCVFELSE